MAQDIQLAGPRLPYPTGVDERFHCDRATWRALVDAVFPAAKSSEAVVLALAYCSSRKLDIMRRPVHIVPMWSTPLKRMVETVWPGIGEHRITAHRTGQYAGCDETEYGPDVNDVFEGVDGDGKVIKVKLTYPAWAQHTLYKRSRTGERDKVVGPRVRFLETYATIKKASQLPNDRWQRAPYQMLGKCFGPETEVLTDQGFQRLDAVTGRIMQVTDHGIEPTDAKPFRQEWTGPMVQVVGDALNFRVTPNHDMVLTDGKIEAVDLLARSSSRVKDRIPISVSGTRPDAPISDRAIQLAAAFVCDGYRRPYDTFTIAVSRPYKIEALEGVGGYSSRHTRHCAGDCVETETRVITTQADKEVFSYRSGVLEGLLALTKTFDREALLSLSQRQARLLVDTMLLHDGSDNGRGTMRFYSSRESILAGFEVAAIAAGYSVSRRRTRVSDIGGPNFSVTVSDKQTLPVFRCSASQADDAGIEMAAANPDGEVWCCRVPSGVIVVRREGFSMLCGNCAEAATLRMAFPEELGNEPVAEEMEGREIDHTIGGSAYPLTPTPAAAEPPPEPAPAVREPPDDHGNGHSDEHDDEPAEPDDAENDDITVQVADEKPPEPAPTNGTAAPDIAAVSSNPQPEILVVAAHPTEGGRGTDWMRYITDFKLAINATLPKHIDDFVLANDELLKRMKKQASVGHHGLMLMLDRRRTGATL